MRKSLRSEEEELKTKMVQQMTPRLILSFIKLTIEPGYQSQLKAQMPEDRATISSSQIQVC